MIIRFVRNGKTKYGWFVEDRVRVIEGDIFKEGELTVMTGLEVPLREVKLVAPCVPTHMLIVSEDREDLSTFVTRENVKLVGTSEVIDTPALPSQPNIVSFGIGAVIKREAPHISSPNADDYIMGLTNVLVVKSHGEEPDQYFVGPGIVPKLNSKDLTMKIQLNDEVIVQEWNLDLLHLLKQASMEKKLYAGDILFIQAKGNQIMKVEEGDKIEISTEGFPFAASWDF